MPVGQVRSRDAALDGSRVSKPYRGLAIVFSVVGMITGCVGVGDSTTTTTEARPTTVVTLQVATVDPVTEVLGAMADACFAVLSWQDEFLAGSFASRLPSLQPVVEAHAALRAAAGYGYEPARLLEEDIAVILRFYNLPVGTPSEEAFEASLARNRAMYHAELRCGYLADGVPELAGWVPDPALIPTTSPGALAAVRACLAWVGLFTDRFGGEFDRYFLREQSVSQAIEARDADEERWETLLDGFVDLYATDALDDVEEYSRALREVSLQCEQVIQVPVRLQSR